MNVLDVLGYGHQTVLDAVDGLTEETASVQGVVGVWSAKDVVAHLASFEQVLADVLGELAGSDEATPALDAFRIDRGFNDRQVALRSGQSLAETLDEYTQCHERVMDLARRISPETFEQEGTLPWYGEQYDLEDLVVYAFYGHKREHGAQIALFKKRR